MTWTLWIKIWTPEFFEDEDEYGTHTTERQKPAIQKIEKNYIEELAEEYENIAIAGEDGVQHEIIALLDDNGYEIKEPSRRYYLTKPEARV